MRIIYDTKKIIKLYQSGKSSIEISNITGLHRTSITRILKRNGIARRSLSKSHQKYEINEYFFDIIDSEEKAYVLGFIYADGNLTRNQLEICIQEGDKDILEKISKLIYPKGKPLGYRPSRDTKFNDITYSCKPQYRLTIINEKIKNSITKLGVTPNKSLNITFPKNIEKKFHRHFIRGYFDGDG